MTDAKKFAARFSSDDWSTLCRDERFAAAIAAGELGQAEVIAHDILIARPLADSAAWRRANPEAAAALAERADLRLRAGDEIDGLEVVLKFRRGKVARLLRTEWEALIARSPEPHALAARHAR